jgi:hypothetical protein
VFNNITVTKGRCDCMVVGLTTTYAFNFERRKHKTYKNKMFTIQQHFADQ